MNRWAERETKIDRYMVTKIEMHEKREKRDRGEGEREKKH